MKKVLVLLSVLIMLLCACGGKSDTPPDTKEDEPNNTQIGDYLDDVSDAVVPSDELHTDGEGNYASDPTDEDGELMEGWGSVKADGEPGSWGPEYYWELGDEMTEDRAAYRIMCDETNYEDTVFLNDSFYTSKMNEWLQTDKSWDYAKFEGHVTWTQHQDGFTAALLQTALCDRLVLVTFEDNIIFNQGDSLNCYGEVYMDVYQDGLGNDVDCFAMKVMDWYYVKLGPVFRSPYTNPGVVEMYDGPVDWDAIPLSCQEAWFGADRMFETPDGKQYLLRKDTANGWPYTVQKWGWDSYYNALHLAVYMNGHEDAYESVYDEELYTWIDLEDGHFTIRNSAGVSIANMENRYDYYSEEHDLLEGATTLYRGVSKYVGAGG